MSLRSPLSLVTALALAAPAFASPSDPDRSEPGNAAQVAAIFDGLDDKNAYHQIPALLDAVRAPLPER